MQLLILCGGKITAAMNHIYDIILCVCIYYPDTGFRGDGAFTLDLHFIIINVYHLRSVCRHRLLCSAVCS